MGGQSTEFLKKVADEFFCIKSIVISDNDGVLICYKAAQLESDKYLQTTCLLISAVNQTQSNLQKTKTYTELKILNFYYDDHLIHLAHVKNLMITIFFTAETNIQLAKEISTQISVTFQKLNAKIPEIRTLYQ